MDDAALWDAFHARTLSHDEWTHRAHLRMAFLHLAKYPDLDEAHLRIRAGIIRLNATHGLEETPKRGYHETLTRVWLVLVQKARAIEPCADSLTFLARHDELLDREAPLRHYSRDRLFSATARSIFVPPDLREF